jgi:succinate-semialdehyde dehydrogenase/glutarate-semialdehyde dehydrogenase
MVQGVTIENGCIINLNPATDEIISKVPCTLTTDIDAMIQTAANAQKAWAKVPAKDRIDLLRKGLTELAKQSIKLQHLIVSEMGKPLEEAKQEVDGAVSKDAYLDILLQALAPKQHATSRVIRQPLGVVAVLSPWNFPADEILLLLLPALGSGNACIVKPSEVTPETGALVVATLQTVLPTGVLQLAQGDGAVGAALVSHAGTNMIAMTGSSATGKKILESAAPQLKRLVLELGGKDPMIIFDDADLEKAARDAVAFSLCNAGQVCCSVERIYVAASIYETMKEQVRNIAKDYKVGNGLDESVKVGPLVSSMQRDKVKQHVNDAIQKGAKVVYQSEHVPTVGTFHPVTVLADVTDRMLMYREETFGPVVALTPFDGSEDEAIRLANDTEYGLAGSVYTKDMDRAERVATAIQAGQVGINCYSLENMNIACPWVGHKNSGYGYHSGQEGFHQFSIPKTLVFVPE